MLVSLSCYADQSENDIEAILPLTPVQQGLLFQTLYARKTAIEYTRASCTFDSDLTPRDLRRACEAVVARHGALRTGFFWESPHRPVQVVFNQAALPWIELDGRGVENGELSQWLTRFRAGEGRPNAWLSEAPLLRCGLLRIAEQRYELICGYHPLVLDSASVGVLFGEIRELYQSYHRNSPSTLASAPPYTELLRWVEAQDAQGAECFWRARLAGLERASFLSLPRKTREARSPVWDVCERLLEEDLSSCIARLAAECAVRSDIVILAAWALFLCRSSGCNDVVFCAPISGHSLMSHAAQPVVGSFTNVIPVRVHIENQVSVRELLERLLRYRVEAEAYSFTPLEAIGRWVGPGACGARFESLVTFGSAPGELHIGLPVRPPLILRALSGERLSLQLEFSREHLEESNASQIMDRLVRVLTQLVADPKQRLGAISYLTNSERRILIDEWSGRKVTTPGPERFCLHERFAEQALLQATAIALAYEGQQLTYHELSRRANRFAQRLFTAGIRGNVPIVMAFERGIESIVALLGILEAGAFCVPLDPHWSPRRIRSILNDLHPAAVACAAAAAPVFAEFRGPIISGDGVDRAEPSGEALFCNTRPTDLCYVVYSSGSNGRPHGVCIEHRNVAHLFAATRHQHGMSSEDIWVQSCSPTSDMFIWEVWGALLHGGRLEICPAERVSAPGELLRWLEETGASLMSQTPTEFQLLLRTARVRGRPLPGRLRKVFLYGEALCGLHGNSRSGCGPDGPQLINMYGATEVTVHATQHRGPMEAADDPARHLIGRPIAGYRVYILEPSGNLAPPGVPGEIYIGGEGVVRGYYNRPDLDASRFLPDPFEKNGRVYRTGDCARFNEQGEIEYLGRLDQQVNICGFRIELGEVENVLAAHPGVDDVAVAVDHQGIDGHPRLVGFYVTAAAATNGFVTPAELRHWVAQELPQHAVPEALFAVDHIPVDTNGQPDRKALARLIASI